MKEKDIKKVSPYSALVKVIGFESQAVKLMLDELQVVISWPSSLLPSSVQEGDIFYLRLGNKEVLAKEYEEIARKVIEEMIN